MGKIYCPSCGKNLIYGRIKISEFASFVQQKAWGICKGCGEAWEVLTDSFDNSVKVSRE